MRPSEPRGEAGFALLTALLAVLLLSLAATGAQLGHRVEREREREAELLFVGSQFDSALRRYFAATPGGIGEYPRELAELLEDRRGPVPVRHLRRIYPDPVTGSGDWGLVRRGGRIVAVHSLAERAPIRRAGFPAGYERFEQAGALSDWVFGPGVAAPGERS